MKPTDPGILLVCKVTPNASKSALGGWTQDSQGRAMLIVKLAAPPVDGKANQELIRFLAKTLQCSKGDLILERGASARQKALRIPTASQALLPPQ